jgi:hypothetical protein
LETQRSRRVALCKSRLQGRFIAVDRCGVHRKCSSGGRSIALKMRKVAPRQKVLFIKFVAFRRDFPKNVVNQCPNIVTFDPLNTEAVTKYFGSVYDDMFTFCPRWSIQSYSTSLILQFIFADVFPHASFHTLWDVLIVVEMCKKHVLNSTFMSR